MADLGGLLGAGIAYADMSLARQWREADMIQRKINNLRREMDEKTTQLKAISSLAALVAGFDIVVLVELSIPDDIPEVLLVLMGSTTALTVCLMTLAFVTSTLMMVGILKAFDVHNVKQPFREFWIMRCEEDWMRAFGFFTIGVPCFLLNLALCGWVKFYDYKYAAGAITVICGIAIIVWYLTHRKWGSFLAENVHVVARDAWLQQGSRMAGLNGVVVPNEGQNQSGFATPEEPATPASKGDGATSTSTNREELGNIRTNNDTTVIGTAKTSSLVARRPNVHVEIS